jgi:simple sugar transport system ATP-binding protein
MALTQVISHIRETSETYGLPIDPLRPVHTLAVGQMQRVEIIRALLTRPRLLILDEPTSVLTPQATSALFETLRQLAGQGCSLLYISHKLNEIQALCDACTVLRAGRVTGQCDPRVETTASLSRLMIGTSAPELARTDRAKGAPMLQVRDLTLKRIWSFGVDLKNVALTVHAGEIVGIAGVSGNGQHELLGVLTGEDRRSPDDSIKLGDQNAGRQRPAWRRAQGLHFAPEERLGRGVVPQLSLSKNLLLTRAEAVGRFGWLNLSLLRTQASTIIERFGIKASGPSALARSLSGGNLQKFIMGREIDAKPLVFIAAQPTWGVDVGASAQIYEALLALREAGGAVLVVSEELDELLTLCDRLSVIAQGRLSPSINRQDASAEQLGQWMSGLWETTDSAQINAQPSHVIS